MTAAPTRGRTGQVKKPLNLVQLQPEEDREAEMRPLDFGILKRLFVFTRPHARIRNALFGVVALRAVQNSVVGWAFAAVVSGPIARHDGAGIIVGVIGYVLLMLFQQGTFHFRSRLALELGESVVHDLRNAIYAHLQRMPMSYFHRTKLGRIISRMTSDVDAVRTGVQDVAFVGIVNVGQMLGAAVIMACYDWRLFLVVVALVPVLWVINQGFRMRMSRATRASHESFSRVTAALAESVNGIRVTQGFVRGDLNARLFGDLIRDHSRVSMNQSYITSVFMPLLDFNSQLFTALLLLLGGIAALDAGTITVETLIAFFFMASVFFAPIQQLGNLYTNAMMAMAGAERVFTLLDSKPDWEDAVDAREIQRIEGKVEFRHLSFGYDPTRLILHDIDFVAEPGQTVALVGHTGGGKSSIINLIAKFYLPTSGELYIDGREIRSIESDSLHKQLGIVLQSNFLFSGTVMDNIRVGKTGATDADINEAARKLDTLDLLEALPDGLKTVVGEKGAGISLGQRQLICFTRAMLADPRILILDEATSSVDAMTEARLQKALATLLRGRTSFVVAHRLSTIRHANLVLVLDKGRIVERGVHLQLLADDGVYAQLYRQFIRVDDE
jgi:ATP-binding cassette, subfamily B, bacterial